MLKKKLAFLHKNLSGPSLLRFIYLATFINLLIMQLMAIGHGSLSSRTCQFDCFWYTDVIKNGYSTHPLILDQMRLAQANWAFFPLYPVIAYGIHKYLFIGTHTSELLINIILWPLLIYLIYQDLLQRKITVDPVLYTIFMVIFPFNIWYTSQYSETLFGLLLVCIIMALRQKRLLIAAICCFLISLSRPTGFLSVLFIAAWSFYVDIYRNRKTLPKATLFNLFQENLCLISTAGAGLSLYVLYLYHLMGDGFAFFHIQIAWLRKFHWLPVHIIKALHHENQHIFLIYFVIGLYVLYNMFQKGWKLESLLMVFTLVIATSSNFMSVERFTFSNPFVMEFLAVSFIRLPQEKRKTLLPCLFILHLMTIEMWFHESFWLI